MEYRAAKEILSLVFLYFFAFFSVSFFRHEEDDVKVMTDCVR
jgi:hypothetical protein